MIRWRLLLIGVLLGILLGMLYVTMGGARADTPIADPVYVDPAIPNAASVDAKIRSRLAEGDGVFVIILPAGGGKDVSVPPLTDVGSVLLVSGSDVVVAVSRGWPDRVVLELLVGRASNVARAPVDRVLLIIEEIHEWQRSNPRPVHVSPAEPTDFGPYVFWGGAVAGCSVIAVLVWFVAGRVRQRRELYGGLAARADEQQREWDEGRASFDDYIK